MLAPLRQDCLINMAFNLGVHGLLEFNTFLGFMQQGKWGQAVLDLRGTPWFHEVGGRSVRICRQIVSSIHQR
jgi:lysozyme